MGGLKGGSQRAALVLKLPQLQNLCKRDPSGYEEEFQQQLRNYESERELFRLKPGKQERECERFLGLTMFVSHVAPSYPGACEAVPRQLMELLEESGEEMAQGVRLKLAQSLILVRNRGLVDPALVLRLFFDLFRIQDKALRQLLFDHIVNDIKGINARRSGGGGSNPQTLNRSLQSHMFKMMDHDSELAAHRSLMVTVELYRRRVWTDEKTVNIVACALGSKRLKLVITALHFFLNIEASMEEEEGEEEVEVDMHEHAKKRGATLKKVTRQIKARRKQINATEEDKEGLFPAINLLNDPQGVAEKMFKRLKSSSERFEVKLLMMNFVSRVIASHRLLLLPFYSHLQKYIQSHQKEVTQILAYFVQACHEDVPPDEVVPVIKTTANNFVTERCSGEVMAVGINTIKEIIKRCPATLQEDGMDDFVQDLVAYAKHRDKSVVIAARGFLNLIREIYPALLRGRDRGKFHDAKAQPSKYGEQHVAEGVEGAELLTLVQEGILRFSDDSEGEDEEDEEEVGGDDNDDDEEAPQLVPLRESDQGSDDEEEEEEEEEEEGGDEEEREDDDNEEEEEVDLRRIKVAPNRRVDATRILSSEDFAKIRRLKAKADEVRKDPRSRKRRLQQEAGNISDDEESGPGVIMDPGALEGYAKRQRASAAERAASVLQGREDFQSKTHGGGLTNKEKERKKNFVMVRKGKNIARKTKKGISARARKGEQGKREQLKRERRKKRRT